MVGSLLQRKRNNVVGLLNPHKKHHYFGKNGFGAGSNIEHERKKLEVAYEHHKQGHSVITEAIFVNGGRADVLCLDCETCYEVLNTESNERFEAKKEYYPSELLVEGVPCDGGRR